MDYPDDADGDALRRVADDGSDMSQPMDVDFMIDVAGGIAAEAIATAARARGYDVEMVEESVDEGDDERVRSVTVPAMTTAAG